MVSVFISAFTFAQKLQDKKVPALVKASFIKQYPNIKDVQWDKEGERFEASFEVNKIDHSVLFDAQGNVQETEIEIETSQLPQNIKDYVAKKYPNKKIKEASKITDNKGSVTYEAEIKGMDLIFDANGKFVKAQKD